MYIFLEKWTEKYFYTEIYLYNFCLTNSSLLYDEIYDKMKGRDEKLR